MADGGTGNPIPSSGNGAPASGATTLTPQQIADMNASNSALQQQTQAQNAYIQASQAAQQAGPQLQYNPLNDDGTLKNQYKLNGADAYTGALTQQEQQRGATARDTAAATGQSATDQAKESLAMRGGLGSNNQALLQSQGLKSTLGAEQSASNQSAQNLANIGVQGAQANIDQQKANLGTQLTAGQNVNEFNLNKYHEGMAQNAANTQANATLAASNSGGK